MPLLAACRKSNRWPRLAAGSYVAPGPDLSIDCALHRRFGFGLSIQSIDVD
jgi:hypothetical protein